MALDGSLHPSSSESANGTPVFRSGLSLPRKSGLSTTSPLGTLFRLTLASGVPAAVALHLRRGAPVNGRDERGRTPLILAAMRGHAEVCRLLLEAGADAALRDHDGRDALAAARAGGHSPVVAFMATSTPAKAGNGPDPAPTLVRCARQSDKHCAGVLVVPGSPPPDPAATSSPAGGSRREETALAAPTEVEPIAQEVRGTAPGIENAGASQLADGWVAEEEAQDAPPAADDMPEHGTEPANGPVEAAAPAALPVEAPRPEAEVSASAALLWEPEPEPVLVASEGGIETAAAALEAGLTRHTVSIPDPDWVDTDVDLPGTAPAWTAGFVDGFDAYRTVVGLLETALRHGWLPEEDLETLRTHALSSERSQAIAGALRTALGDLGLLIEGEHALDLEREPDGDLVLDEPDFRRSEVADALEFLDGLSGGFRDAEGMLLEAAARAPVLSASEEAFLFREMASSLGTMLRLAASSPSTADIVLSWADRLEAGRLAPKEVSEAEWGVVVEAASAPRNPAAVRTTENDSDGEDESDASDEPDREEDRSAAKALASRLRDAANRITGEGEARQLLGATTLTSRRILELAEGALPPGARAPRRVRGLMASASGSAASDLRLLRRPPEGRQRSRPVNDIRAALERYLALRDAIVEANLRRVVWRARRYARGLVPFLDLVQEGQIGLLRAIDRYDVGRGLRFGTYANWWIRQTMTRCVQDAGRTIRVPVHMLERIAKTRRTTEAFRAKHGFDPQPTDIAGDMKVDVSALERALAADHETVRLEEVEDQSVEDWDASDLVDGSAPSSLVDPGTPLAAALQADLRRQLLAGLQELDQRLARILDLRFGITDGEPLTLEEVGHIYGVTRERIRQIERKALNQMSQHLPSRFFERMVP